MAQVVEPLPSKYQIPKFKPQYLQERNNEVSSICKN
jgi:hypothetical protein